METKNKEQIRKTVGTFSRILERPLQVEWGEDAKTDGKIVVVPNADSPLAYTTVEHLLSTVVFDTNFKLMTTFPGVYGSALWTLGGSVGFDSTLVRVVHTVLSVVNNYRVQTLWDQLYPGSAYRIWDYLKSAQQYSTGSPIGRVCDVLSCADFSTADQKVSDPLDEALARVRTLVHGGAFADALLGTKIIIRALLQTEAKRKNPTDSSSEAARIKAIASMSRSTETTSKLPETPNDPFNTIPDVDEIQEITEALNKDTDNATPDPTHKEAMQRIVDKIRAHDGEASQRDIKDILGQNILTPVVFETPLRGESYDKFVQEDETIQRLRSIFIRALARRKNINDVSGTEIDSESWIRHLAARSDRVEPFLVPGPARGFRTLLLLDRSTSMTGLKTKQVDFACRALSQAMSFPFTTFDVWTFRSLPGQTSDTIIGRYPKNDKYTCAHSNQTKGLTPLHIAIRAAHNELRYGDEYRSLIVLTDGEPTFDSTELQVGVEEALKDIGRSVIAASRRGVPTYAVIVGNDIPTEDAAVMFPRNRIHIKADRIGSALIKLFSDNFLRYVRAC